MGSRAFPLPRPGRTLRSTSFSNAMTARGANHESDRRVSQGFPHPVLDKALVQKALRFLQTGTNVPVTRSQWFGDEEKALWSGIKTDDLMAAPAGSPGRRPYEAERKDAIYVCHVVATRRVAPSRGSRCRRAAPFHAVMSPYRSPAPRLCEPSPNHRLLEARHSYDKMFHHFRFSRSNV